MDKKSSYVPEPNKHDWYNDYDHSNHSSLSITAIEYDKETFTGLYDQNGNKLHRLKPKVGFDI